MPTPTLLRSGIAGLAALAADDLAGAWRNTDTPDDSEAVLRDVLPPLIDVYGAAAATVAANWYDESRDEAEAQGRFTAIPAVIEAAGAQELVGWALATASDTAALRALIEGGTQRRIANFARQTITLSSVEDPAARGWKRVGVGDCGFCRMLIGRGAVYTEATADFRSHDHCNCAAAPAWR